MGDVMNDGADLIMHNNSRDTGVPVASIDDSLGTSASPVGCGLGAACEAAVGLWSLALPASLALLAFAMGFAVKIDDRER